MLLPLALLAASLFAADRDPAAAYVTNAQKAIEERNIQEAKAQLDLALKVNPRSSEAWLMLAAVELQNGEAAAAIQHYHRALELDPNSFGGHYNLALAYVREHKLPAARGELERAVALNPFHPDAAYNLGMVLLELENPRDAVKYLRQVQALQPGRPDVAFNLVRAELAAGDFERAREEARQRAGSFVRDARWQVAVGRLFLNAGHAQDAIPHLRDGLRLQPDSEDARHLLAAAYLQSQQPDLAVSLIQNPKTADDHFLRASALYLKHNLREAEPEAGRAPSSRSRGNRAICS